MTPSASPNLPYHPWTTFSYAREEAHRRGDRVVGTEHLVLGLIRDPEMPGLLQTDLDTAREALAAIDRDALKAIGIDAAVDAPEIPAPTSSRLDRTPTGRLPRPTVKELLTHRMQLTPGAKAALRVAGMDLRRGRLSDPRQVLAALLALEPPDPAAELFNQLGVDRAALRANLDD
jgi:hypothetical protein